MHSGRTVVLVKNMGLWMEDTSTSVKLLEPCVKTSSLGIFSLRHWMKPSEEAEDGGVVAQKLRTSTSAKPLDDTAIFFLLLVLVIVLTHSGAWLLLVRSKVSLLIYSSWSLRWHACELRV
jgi:hypothetical protein